MPGREDDNAELVSRRRSVRPLLIAASVSIIGDGAFITTAPLLAASLSSDPVAVATVTAAAQVPWLVFGLPAGALVDRWPRRLVMVSADLFRAAVVALFGVLVMTDSATLVTLALTILLVGMAQCLFDPAAQSVIPTIVGRDKAALERINGRYWALEMFGRTLIGPLAGSWIFTIGRVLPFFANSVSFVISAIFVSRLPKMPPPRGEHEPVLAAVRTGFRHLRRSRELLVLALGMIGLNFGFNVSIATFVLYTHDILRVGPVGYGALFALLACGGIIAGWRGTRLIRGVPARYVHALALAGQGTVWLLVAISANVWVTGALFVCIGAIVVLNTTAISSARQRLAPEGSLGRIVSVFRVCSLGAGGIGALVGGWIAADLGLATPMLVAAAVQFVAAVIVWVFRR